MFPFYRKGLGTVVTTDYNSSLSGSLFFNMQGSYSDPPKLFLMVLQKLEGLYFHATCNTKTYLPERLYNL